MKNAYFKRLVMKLSLSMAILPFVPYTYANEGINNEGETTTHHSASIITPPLLEQVPTGEQQDLNIIKDSNNSQLPPSINEEESKSTQSSPEENTIVPDSLSPKTPCDSREETLLEDFLAYCDNSNPIEQDNIQDLFPPRLAEQQDYLHLLTDLNHIHLYYKKQEIPADGVMPILLARLGVFHIDFISFYEPFAKALQEWLLISQNMDYDISCWKTEAETFFRLDMNSRSQLFVSLEQRADLYNLYKEALYSAPLNENAHFFDNNWSDVFFEDTRDELSLSNKTCAGQIEEHSLLNCQFLTSLNDHQEVFNASTQNDTFLDPDRSYLISPLTEDGQFFEDSNESQSTQKNYDHQNNLLNQSHEEQNPFDSYDQTDDIHRTQNTLNVGPDESNPFDSASSTDLIILSNKEGKSLAKDDAALMASSNSLKWNIHITYLPPIDMSGCIKSPQECSGKKKNNKQKKYLGEDISNSKQQNDEKEEKNKRSRRIRFQDEVMSIAPQHIILPDTSGAPLNSKNLILPFEMPQTNINFMPHELEYFLNLHMEGQEKAAQSLAVNVHKHYLSLRLNEWYNVYKNLYPDNPYIKSYIPFKKNNTLVVGPTGCGKTLSIELISRFFEERHIDIPLVKVSAASLTRTGYVGPSVSDIFKTVLEKVGGDIEKAQTALIYVDEIDKIASAPEVSTRDIGGSAVQYELLEVLQGSEITLDYKKSNCPMEGQTQINLDTSNMCFILGGSFKGMTAEQNDYISDSKLEAFGFGKEFLGRLQQRIMFNSITKNSLRKMLENKYESRIIQQQNFYKLGFNIDLVFEEEALEAIANKAILFPTGARVLQSLVDRIISCKIPMPSYCKDHSITITAKDIQKIIKDPELSAEEETIRRRQELWRSMIS